MSVTHYTFYKSWCARCSLWTPFNDNSVAVPCQNFLSLTKDITSLITSGAFFISSSLWNDLSIKFHLQSSNLNVNVWYSTSLPVTNNVATESSLDFFSSINVVSLLPIIPAVPDILLNTSLSSCFLKWWTNITDILFLSAKDSNNEISDIIYREKIVCNKKIYIIYNEPLTSSDKISDFIIRSLNSISSKKISSKILLKKISNDISNFKYEIIDNYDALCFYLHRGFTIILIEGEKEAIVLETKGDIKRGISTPDSEFTVRGAKDAFIEDYQTNIGLIKKRVRSNDLWIDNVTIGKYTSTQIGIISVNGIVKKELVDIILKKIKKIDIDGILNSDSLKNLIEKENKNAFPTILTTERPDIVCRALLEGKVAIVVDNSPYVLVIPALLNDFFKTSEDIYGKSLNVSFTRIIKYIAFFIALLTPAVYIAITTYNQEMIPTDLLISFATQRDGVPFPAFFEAIIMMIAFEILRESDLRVPSSSGSALSIVGAIILGDAAVSAGIVSPIMIIVIAITAISSLPFSELDFINALRWYRLIFMLGAAFLGIIGILVVFILFLTKLSSTKSFGKPYLIPFAPTYKEGLKNSIIKLPLKMSNKRRSYLSDNTIKRSENNEKN